MAGKLRIFRNRGQEYKDGKERKLAEIIEFDQKNLPVWYGEETELSEKETLDYLNTMDSEEKDDPGKRTEPHDRVILVKKKEDRRSAAEIGELSREELQSEGEMEPEFAVVGKDNYVRGTVPVHMYLDENNLEKMLQMLDSGQVSITHSAFPEAIYVRVEDGMEKGRVAWAGTINGEAEYSINRSQDLTADNFLRSDNIHVHENALSGEMEAIEAEAHEENADLASGMDYYTGDYRGWNDPDYEPEDDMERQYWD